MQNGVCCGAECYCSNSYAAVTRLGVWTAGTCADFPLGDAGMNSVSELPSGYTYTYQFPTSGVAGCDVTANDIGFRKLNDADVTWETGAVLSNEIKLLVSHKRKLTFKMNS